MIAVIDASVAVKWYVPETHTANAEKLLGSFELHAPELILPEFGNIIWKKVRRGELRSNDGASIIEAFLGQQINIHRQASLLKAAFTGAELSGQTVYDWTYLALAVSLACPFVTADEKFFNALANTKMGSRLSWIGSL